MFVFPYINIHFFSSIDLSCCLPAFPRRNKIWSWLTAGLGNAFDMLGWMVRYICVHFFFAFTFTRLQNICSIMFITSTVSMSRMFFHYHVFDESLLLLLLLLFRFSFHQQIRITQTQMHEARGEELNTRWRTFFFVFTSFSFQERNFSSSVLRCDEMLPWTTFCGN
jgi:phage shock protein PspC (stress-responsive transcriptional regulator)